MWTTVDTHTPFSGYDSKEQYKKHTEGSGLDSSYSKEGLNDRYSTVLRYTDEQVGEVYNYLKKYRNNTIFIMLGDHGARDTHTYQDENVVKNVTFDP